MVRLIIEDRDVERADNLAIDRIEIVTDSSREDKVELYILDALGERVEGGTFDRSAFMTHVLEFYNANY
jgi:hypothetical protein